MSPGFHLLFAALLPIDGTHVIMQQTARVLQNCAPIQ